MLPPAVLPHIALGQSAEAAAAPAAGLPMALVQYAPFLLMFAVLYFLVFRPAGRQKREQAQFLAALKKDDEVMTTGGIHGRIAAVEEQVVVLEIADKVRVRILRDRIGGRWQPGGAAARAGTVAGSQVAPAAK